MLRTCQLRCSVSRETPLLFAFLHAWKRGRWFTHHCTLGPANTRQRSVQQVRGRCVLLGLQRKKHRSGRLVIAVNRIVLLLSRRTTPLKQARHAAEVPSKSTASNERFDTRPRKLEEMCAAGGGILRKYLHISE